MLVRQFDDFVAAEGARSVLPGALASQVRTVVEEAVRLAKGVVGHAAVRQAHLLIVWASLRPAARISIVGASWYAFLVMRVAIAVRWAPQV